MIKVFYENGTYDIDVYENEEKLENQDSIMGLTVDTKNHMYYVDLPKGNTGNEFADAISNKVKMCILNKNFISRIAKNKSDSKNLSICGETKAYDKEILNKIFEEKGIIPITYRERNMISEDLEDIKNYNLELISEDQIFKYR